MFMELSRLGQGEVVVFGVVFWVGVSPEHVEAMYLVCDFKESQSTTTQLFWNLHRIRRCIELLELVFCDAYCTRYS